MTYVTNSDTLEDLHVDQSNEMDRLYFLMNQYGEEIKRLVYTYTKNWSQTEDLTQEIFLNVHIHLHTFQNQSSLKTWIYQIAINKCKDYLRSWYYKKTVITDKVFQIKNDHSPEQEYLVSEQKQVINQFILELPVKYREVIILYYFKDFSIEETAAALDMNMNTIKSRLSRARRMLETKVSSTGGNLNG
jgi:RNA polymerase sigma-70 factor (ECF subfamily)